MMYWNDALECIGMHWNDVLECIGMMCWNVLG